MEEFDIFFRTRLDYWKKSNLSYGWYWFLAVFFGWLGLDQLYLGSPIAGIGKIILNIVMLGWPWLYDALNATLNKEHIKASGPINPLIGHIGIGAGRFVDEDSTVKPSHKNMLIYGLILICFGIFGADSFLVGDKLSGYMRIIMLFSFFLTPIAFIWWLYKLYLYFIRTDQLLDQNYVYFDAPKPTDPSLICPNVLEQITVWFIDTIGTVVEYIPVLNNFVPLIKSLADSLRVAYGMVKETAGVVINTATTVAEAGESIEGAFDPDAIKQAIDDKSREEKSSGDRGEGQKGGGKKQKESPVSMIALVVLIISFLGYISMKVFTECKKLITGIMRNNIMKNNGGNNITKNKQNEQRRGEAYPDDSAE